MEPDMCHADFYCGVCDAHMTSAQMWDSHIAGKRHAKNLKKKKEEEPPPPEGPRAGNTLDVEPIIQSRLNDVREPLIGLRHVCEVQKEDPDLDPTYSCYICRTVATRSMIIEHMLTTKHRLNVLKTDDPNGYMLVEGMGLKKDAKDSIVFDKAAELEEKKGRGRMEVKLAKPDDEDTNTTRKRPNEDDRFSSGKRVSREKASGDSRSRNETWHAMNEKSHDTYKKSRDSYERSRDSYERSRDTNGKPRESSQRSRETYEKPRESYQKSRDTYEKPRENYQKSHDSYEKPREPHQKPHEPYKKLQGAHEASFGDSIRPPNQWKTDVPISSPDAVDVNLNDIEFWPLDIQLHYLEVLAQCPLKSVPEAKLAMKALEVLMHMLSRCKLRQEEYQREMMLRESLMRNSQGMMLRMNPSAEPDLRNAYRLSSPREPELRDVYRRNPVREDTDVRNAYRRETVELQGPSTTYRETVALQGPSTAYRETVALQGPSTAYRDRTEKVLSEFRSELDERLLLALHARGRF